MGSEYDFKSLLESPETLGTTLHAMLLEQYGPEVYTWEPETVTLEIIDDFGVEMPSGAFNRWGAIQTVMTTNEFFRRVDAFMAVCNALNTGEPFFTTFDPVTTEEITWALIEVSLNRDMVPLSRAVKGFIRESLALEGYNEANMPEIIKTALNLTEEEGTSIKKTLVDAYRTDNNDILDEFVDEQVGILAYQLEQLPGWTGQVNRFLDTEELLLPEVQGEL